MNTSLVAGGSKSRNISHDATAESDKSGCAIVTGSHHLERQGAAEDHNQGQDKSGHADKYIIKVHRSANPVCRTSPGERYLLAFASVEMVALHSQDKIQSDQASSDGVREDG